MRGLHMRIGPPTFPGCFSPYVLPLTRMMVALLLRRCMGLNLLFLASFWAVLSRPRSRFCAPLLWLLTVSCQPLPATILLLQIRVLFPLVMIYWLPGLCLCAGMATARL